MIGAFNQQLFEQEDLAESFKAVDLSTGANTGQWISLRDYHRASVMLYRSGSAGNAGDQSTVTIQQATSNAGAGAKALNSYRARYKTDMTGPSGDTWTIADVTSPQNAWQSPAGFGDKATLLAVDLEAQLLDDANGFHWIQASVNQAAHACIGWCFLLLYSGRHPQRVPLSALTNL